MRTQEHDIAATALPASGTHDPLATALWDRAPQLADDAGSRLPGTDLLAPIDRLALLRTLALSHQLGRELLLTDHVGWMLSRATTAVDGAAAARRELDAVVAAVTTQLGSGAGDEVRARLDTAGDDARRRAALPDVPAPPSALLGEGEVAALGRRFLQTLLAARRRAAIAMIDAALDDGLGIEPLYLDVLQPALVETGRLWQLDRISIRQEQLVTASVQLLMARAAPQVLSTPRRGRRLDLAAVAGERHQLGSQMLADLFELAGWDTALVDGRTDRLRARVRDDPPDVLALSVGHVTNLASFIATLAAVRAGGPVPVLAGGRILSRHPGLARELGADAEAGDARSAIRTAERLVTRGPDAGGPG